MIDDNSLKINMADQVSEKLGFRDSASQFFNILNKNPIKNIEIDFKDVKFMSRSFAHEYLQRKKDLDKVIVELNKPEEIDMAFNAVIRSIENPEKIKVKSSGIINIS